LTCHWVSRMKPSNPPIVSHVDVAVVGGGTSGLVLAAELKRGGIDKVVVLEREATAGGVPRHCGHYPFGVLEYGRLMKGPDYALRNLEAAQKYDVEIRTSCTVTKLHPNGRLSLSTPSGEEDVIAKRVVLCTGVRESSRSQRFISGDRPLGVVTTGALQAMVYLQGLRPFRRPVILGSELVSFSAINTCRHLGIQPVAMVEEHDRIVARKVLRPFLTLRGVPLFAGVQDLRIEGSQTVECLSFTDQNGRHQSIKTDGVIISGRFRPEAALLRSSHLEVDAGSGGPVIDQFGQCSDPAYYSAGNLLRPAETSGWCWREGVATAKRIAQDLSGEAPNLVGSVRLNVASPSIRFIVPQKLALSDRPCGMDKFQIGLNTPARGTLSAIADGNPLWSSTLNGRPVRRIQRPLKALLACEPGSEIQITLEPGS